MIAQSTIDLLRHLAGKPGHDEVKADFRQLLIGEFGAELSALDFERRVPEVRGRLDALIGRTILEAKSDLAKEWPDVERKMPDYLADREKAEGEKFVGIASDGRQWIACELDAGKLIKIKAITLERYGTPIALRRSASLSNSITTANWLRNFLSRRWAWFIPRPECGLRLACCATLHMRSTTNSIGPRLPPKRKHVTSPLF